MANDSNTKVTKMICRACECSPGEESLCGDESFACASCDGTVEPVTRTAGEWEALYGYPCEPTSASLRRAGHP